MTYPTPPGDNVPLYEGLDPSWNDFVSVIPEEKRADFASKVSSIHQQYEPLKQWEDFSKSGITPEHASTALSIYSMVENQPQKIYEELGKYLGISPQAAQQVAETVQQNNNSDDDEIDPRIATMQQQLETLMQIKVAEHNQAQEAQRRAEAEAAIESEWKALKKKHPEITERDEGEIFMRASQKDLNLEQAYNDYLNFLSEVRRGRPTPMVMGAGGSMPAPGIDVKKLDTAGTKAIVAQMLAASNQQRS